MGKWNPRKTGIGMGMENRSLKPIKFVDTVVIHRAKLQDVIN